MLSRILQILEEAHQLLCVESIAHILDKDDEIVAAMLDELVLMGRVRVVGGGDTCAACNRKTLCGLPAATAPLYGLVAPGEKSPSGSPGYPEGREER
jgi:hypothetical protein